MAHVPVNHPLGPVYRVLGALTGLYFVAFGILGATGDTGSGLFARAADKVLGQGTNLAWSIVSIVIGAIVLIGAAVGRNRDAAVFSYLGWALLVIGMAMLALLRTDANLFNFTVTTVIVLFLAGTLLITAGLYVKVAAGDSAGDAHAAAPARAATGH
jgi:hypothetical protein